MRRKLLAAASVIQRLMRFMSDFRFRDTVAQTLDDAVDGLRDNGWSGPIHVVGFSFGSLVAIDSLFPLEGGLVGNVRITESVASLTTIGCPIDAVRLLMPGHFTARRGQRLGEDAQWFNVFNGADVLATDFGNQADANYAAQAVRIDGTQTRAQVRAAKYIRIGDLAVTSRRYGSDKLTVADMLVAGGFTSHVEYWGQRDEASCFAPDLVSHWIRPASQDAVPVGLGG